VASPEHLKDARKLRESLASYHQSEDLISLGAYISGANAKLDSSIRSRERVLTFLRQDSHEKSELTDTLSSLKEIAGALA
jgi:flagellum-specific ATP synthase